MSILETIVAKKRKEIEETMAQFPVSTLSQSEFFDKETNSLQSVFNEKKQPLIIAEFKRRSPSKGWINHDADIKEVVSAYASNGAAACSVLTDKDFFGGTKQDILNIRNLVTIPVLRKEFILSEYQILEAKAIGADLILLIAACLQVAEVKALATFAKSLGLEVILEIHDEAELDHIGIAIDFVGINNRNLKTFSVNLMQSVLLKEKIGKDYFAIAESGINSVADVTFLHKEGFRGFLIGELFMRNTNPAIYFADFMQQLKQQYAS